MSFSCFISFSFLLGVFTVLIFDASTLNFRHFLKFSILHVVDNILSATYLAINGKSSAETILQFELYPPLSTHNTEFLWQRENS